MNKKIASLAIALIHLLCCSVANAQLKDVKWSEPESHPCYKGLKISVLNMGYQDPVKACVWGIRITNKYTTPVTVRYCLSVGEKNTGTRQGVTKKLASGETCTDGGDVFTGDMFQSTSSKWFLAVWQVCFDGASCGGPNECFADCDRIAGNANQPCDASGDIKTTKNPPSIIEGIANAGTKEEGNNNYSGEYTTWMPDDKEAETEMGRTEKGIYWKRKNSKENIFFEKLPSGVYRYEVGKDYYFIEFVSATRIQFSKNGMVTNHFNLVGAAEQDGESKVRSGIWGGGGDVRITVKEDGIIYHSINSLDVWLSILQKNFFNSIPAG